MGDRDLYSDEVDFDRHWLMMLADAAGMSLGERKIGDVRNLLDATRLSTIEDGGGSPRHRAEADARRLASALKRKIGD